MQDGYYHKFDKRLVTVWSAPNYMYRCGNVAAIMEINEHLYQTFKIFSAAPSDSGSSVKNRKTQLPDYFL
jgi:serine/threonine-protein phosphatase 4 catalytic subunit